MQIEIGSLKTGGAAHGGQGHPANIVSVDGLLALMRQLDALLESAVNAAEAAYGACAGTDPLRGLHVEIGDVQRMLTRAPGASPLWLEGVRSVLADGSNGLSGLAWLQDSFDVSNFDLDIILVALAPVIDLKYERLYAYLQDDVSRRRPTVDLALNLLCSSAQEKLTRRKHFATDAPLIRERLIHLIPDPRAVLPPLLAHYLKLDEQIVRLVLGEESLDRRLASFCEMIEPRCGTDGIPLNDAVTSSLRPLVDHAWAARRTLTLYLQGPAGIGKRHVGLKLAGEIDARLFVADLCRAPTTAVDFELAVGILLREALLRDAIVYLDGLDALRSDQDTRRYRLLLDAVVAHSRGVTLIAGEHPWTPGARGLKGVLAVALPMPGFADRRAYWQLRLGEKGISIAEADLTALADRFRLTPAQIADAVETAAIVPAAGLRPALEPPRTRHRPICSLPPVPNRAKRWPPWPARSSPSTAGRTLCCPMMRWRNCASCASG